MKQSHTIHTSAGFSLIEMIVAFSILAVGLVALTKLQSIVLTDEILAKQQADAQKIAQAKLEQFRDFETLTGTNAYQDIISGSDTSPGTNTSYTLNWTVTDYSSPNYKNIDITVSWSGPDGSSNSITLNSHIGETDPVDSGILMQGSGAGSIQI